MKIVVINEQNDLPIDENKIEPIVAFVLQKEERSTDEVTIYFLCEEEICRIHGDYFGDSSLTDCMSFPMDSAEESSHYHILGDIFISPKVAKEYALKHQESAYKELTLYLIHALLHLLGYSDKEEVMRKEMHSLQESYLDELAAKQLLLSAPLS